MKSAGLELSSIWHVAQCEELKNGSCELHAFETEGMSHRVVATRTGVWVVSEWAGGARLGTRAAFSPGELEVEECRVAADGLSVDLAISSTIGDQATSIRVDPGDATVSATTTLRPVGRLRFEGWPRDVVADLASGTRGVVHASQRGLRTGLVHAGISGPGDGSFMYVQDLSHLADFCQETHASGADTVGGVWPDLGFALPVGSEPLKRGDERTGSIARWLPAREDMLDGSEPHEHPRLMDSWYILHPLLNLARLAKSGDEQARTDFLRALDVEIKIAQHFDYEWPVFYDVDTLEVIKAESEPGKGGERDVPGLYAHVVLQAYELTDDRRYLDEAIAAANALRGKGFEVAYQMNNVAFGMTAMARVAAITGDREFLDISRVLCACLVDNVGLWSMRYGHARDRASFFGVFPMPTAPYTSAYEQAEVSAAVLEYIKEVGDDLAPPLAVLLPEFIRHVTARLDTYYPPNLAAKALSKEPKTGHLIRELWIPVEDLGDGWDEAGTVGQEVYGAGTAFSTVSRSYIRVPDRPTEIYCEYPYAVRRLERDRVVIRVVGDGRLVSRVRVLAIGDQPHGLTEVKGSTGGTMEPAHERARWSEFWIAAGQDLTLTFT